ncbi:PQQ-dependent sugar dehydrogenase [Pseudonocardia acaciae]|uniref:PQQ-dependent sugar dehydrogenase n=1 Tax=Pseudonocardia acaciae TaxID=551276 RepID=UPI001FE0321C|nr:PQQ-dependent sugar dehydrogenase [Pseudonocardia acaciae]
MTVAVVLAAAACSSPAPPAAPPPPPRERVIVQPPLPDPVPSGSGLVLSDFMMLPQSTPNPPPESGDNLDRWARINYLGEIPDGSGRLYVPDLNGKLYTIKDGGSGVYLDVGAQVGPNFWNHEGIGTGFGFVAFHPDFKRNGKFYTVHTEGRDALKTQTPDLPFPKETYNHGVVTEWTASNPAANTFAGTRREVLRIGFVNDIHGILQIGFNPTARPGGEDYGLLYLAVGDGGAAGDAEHSLKTTVPQDKGVPQGKILRIDPTGTNGPRGRYGIPATNPFVGKAGALGEIYASGLRGPYRFSWDPGEDHRMFLGNIGNEEVESIYEVRPGDNYGWSEREGPFVVKLGEGPNSCDIQPVPADDEKNGFTYPVAAYGHNKRPTGWPHCEDSGYAVIAGFVYRGNDIPELQGKFVFGDGVTGRIFYTNVQDMRRDEKLAPIHELALFDGQGRPVTMQGLASNPNVELAGQPKVDLRFGSDARGELYVLAKANGKIWKVTGMRRT